MMACVWDQENTAYGCKAKESNELVQFQHKSVKLLTSVNAL
jgi:hypothetical protein